MFLSKASGFCFVNDIVLACQMLLQQFKRILYIDIDVHHGDGVQDAFYKSNRVVSLSLHKYGDRFFPGTGNIFEIGFSDGVYHSVNLPLKDGITDEGKILFFLVLFFLFIFFKSLKFFTTSFISIKIPHLFIEYVKTQQIAPVSTMDIILIIELWRSGPLCVLCSSLQPRFSIAFLN